MKTNRNNSQRSAFTLIEMVGVLAVIAILAALLVPKIFAAINDSRFSNTVASINSVKTATMSYFGKKGDFTAAASGFDTTLVTEGYMESPLAVKVGDTPVVMVVKTVLTDETVSTKNDGYTIGTTAIPAGSLVVEVTLANVASTDAKEISERIDGVGASSPTGDDVLGRVKYDLATKALRVYIVHK